MGPDYFWSRRGRGTRLDHSDRRRGTDRGRGQGRETDVVKGTIHASRVELNSTAVVKGDIFHRTLIEGSDASMKSARAIVRWNV